MPLRGNLVIKKGIPAINPLRVSIKILDKEVRQKIDK